MVEADSHLKLIPASTLDLYNVFEHILLDIFTVVISRYLQ
jgi:hypothetical protein